MELQKMLSIIHDTSWEPTDEHEPSKVLAVNIVYMKLEGYRRDYVTRKFHFAFSNFAQ
jgi:hypothetical protein